MDINKVVAKKGSSHKSKMTVTVEPELLKEFNLFAKKNRINKSKTISNMIRDFLNEYKKGMNECMQ